MNSDKFQIGDRVISPNNTKGIIVEKANVYRRHITTAGNRNMWVIEYIGIHDKKVQGTIFETSLKIDKQWYREERLKGLLDE
jgi:hypothetical protein